MCHFMTPLDGSLDLEVHRPEVKIKKCEVHKQPQRLVFLFTETIQLIHPTLKHCHDFFLFCFLLLLPVFVPCAQIQDFGLWFSSHLFLFQGIAAEGKCWKRRIEIVIREYHKWRTYFKKRVLYYYIKTLFLSGRC